MTKPRTLLDLTGRQFNKWTVLWRAQNKPWGGEAIWHCQCDCGAFNDVAGSALRDGHSKCCRSCSVKFTTHGGSKTRLYRIWQDMLRRCRSTQRTDYQHYGGRGITVCQEWKDFHVFRDWSMKHGYEDTLTIERKNVDGDYCESNCCWIRKSQQSSNKRLTQRRNDGVPWFKIAQQNGISQQCFRHRKWSGWTPEQAATLPIGSHVKPIGRPPKK